MTLTRTMHPLVGYFDSPTATEPAYDPGVDGTPCVVCAQPLVRPVKTISLMWSDHSGDLSLFFRAHKGCWDGLTDDEKGTYEQAVLSPLRAHSNETTGTQQ